MDRRHAPLLGGWPQGVRHGRRGARAPGASGDPHGQVGRDPARPAGLAGRQRLAGGCGTAFRWRPTSTPWLWRASSRPAGPEGRSATRIPSSTTSSAGSRCAGRTRTASRIWTTRPRPTGRHARSAPPPVPGSPATPVGSAATSRPRAEWRLSAKADGSLSDGENLQARRTDGNSGEGCSASTRPAGRRDVRLIFHWLRCARSPDRQPVHGTACGIPAMIPWTGACSKRPLQCTYDRSRTETDLYPRSAPHLWSNAFSCRKQRIASRAPEGSPDRRYPSSTWPSGTGRIPGLASWRRWGRRREPSRREWSGLARSALCRARLRPGVEPAEGCDGEDCRGHNGRRHARNRQKDPQRRRWPSG